MSGRKLSTRRDILAAGAALTAGGLAACTAEDETGPADAAGQAPAGDEALVSLSARRAVQAMREGEISAVAYAGALLNRALALEDLNAFTTIAPERVLAEADAADRRRAAGRRLGALHGLPIPVKDSINTRDYPTTGGTPALRDWRPPEDAELVRRLRGAGGIVMGKTSIHELSFGWTSNNFAYGPVRNPWDRTRIPGGSSGGTAAAVAARLAPLGVAEDTQGSIRVPAALCGICGFRPTTGRYPNEGVMPITPLFDQVGPHARSVDDLRFFDEVVTGQASLTSPASLEGIRLGVVRDYFFDGVDRSVAEVSEAALARLEDAGAVIVEGRIEQLEELIALTTAQIQGGDVVPRLDEYLATYGAGIDAAELLEVASENIRRDFALYALAGGEFSPTDEEFAAARDVYLPELRRMLESYFVDGQIDAMVFPATMAVASPIGEEAAVEVNGEQLPLETALARNISPASTAGIPGLVLPAGLTGEGLPVGLELDARHGRDRELLALGETVEAVLGRLPPPEP